MEENPVFKSKDFIYLPRGDLQLFNFTILHFNTQASDIKKRYNFHLVNIASRSNNSVNIIYAYCG